MRDLPDPGFAGDDGGADATLAAALAALAAYDADPVAGHRAALEVFAGTRVLVPVVALLGESEEDEAGLTREKTSDMAAVKMVGQDGRTALLAFTGAEPMRRWDPAARPVPVSAPSAALAALQDDAEALVVDVAGPVLFVVEGADLRALADVSTAGGTVT